MTDRPEFTLHYYPFSIYSLMVRFALALGEQLNPETAPKVQVKLVDLQEEENFSEAYLSVNSKGQVPVLSSPSLKESITESRDISTWLCKLQPELLPEQHRETIERLMDQLYSFHALSLSVPLDDRRHGIPNQAAAMLERTDLTDSYRRRLEIKSLFHDQIHSRTLQSDHIEDVEAQARAFINDISAVILSHENEHEGTCIFGEKPTILDAHVTVLAARFIELKRDDLLPVDSRVYDYALGMMAMDEWHRTTHGRPTVWNENLGPAADFDPL